MVFEDLSDEHSIPHAHLSDRKLEVFRLLVAGKRVNEIADQLIISNKTVSSHKKRLMEKNAFLQHGGFNALRRSAQIVRRGQSGLTAFGKLKLSLGPRLLPVTIACFRVSYPAKMPPSLNLVLHNKPQFGVLYPSTTGKIASLKICRIATLHVVGSNEEFE